MKSLFIYDRNDLDAEIPGGVQLCSKQYLSIVEAASDSVELLNVSVSRSVSWRARRRLGLGAYLFYRPSDAESAIRRAALSRPTHVFLNRCELLRLIPLVRSTLPSSKIIVMSHGNQSGDNLYEVAGPGGRNSRGLRGTVATLQLGLDLAAESRVRHRGIDGMCVMSVEEEVLERWLGARRTFVVPRLINMDPIDWEPLSHRVGFVGTLNHTPNLVALDTVCNELRSRNVGSIELRLVGGPPTVGHRIQQQYPFVTYLGRLDDSSLRAEASTWQFFLNPIFWLSRGASMKLGQSLTWCVPSVTTRNGARGYDVNERIIVMSGDEPCEFVDNVIRALTTPNLARAIRNQLIGSMTSWPTAESVGRKLRSDFA